MDTIKDDMKNKNLYFVIKYINYYTQIIWETAKRPWIVLDKKNIFLWTYDKKLL